MAIKSFIIKVGDKEETIEFEDDISFGEMEYIIRNAVDISDITKPKIYMHEYRMQLLGKVLRRAPFQIGDVGVLSKQPRSIMNQIIPEVMKAYPLINCLGDWMTSFLGSEEESVLATQFIPSVPSTMDGPKNT